MNPRSIPHPFKESESFNTLEDLRKVVVYMEEITRDYGVTAAEVFFSEEFTLTIRSEKLTDGSIVINAGISIEPSKS